MEESVGQMDPSNHKLILVSSALRLIGKQVLEFFPSMIRPPLLKTGAYFESRTTDGTQARAMLASSSNSISTSYKTFAPVQLIDFLQQQRVWFSQCRWRENLTTLVQDSNGGFWVEIQNFGYSSSTSELVNLGGITTSTTLCTGG